MPERTSRGPLQVFDTKDPASVNDQLQKIREELDELHNSAAEVEEAVQTSATIPTGTVLPYAGTDAPDEYLICDGAAVSRTTYADLFAVIGETYGAGDSSTTFNVPDLKGRAVFGKAASGTFQTLGDTGGAETDTVAAHSHALAAGVEITNTGSGSWDHTTESGGGATVDILPPYLVLNWIIKV